MYYAKLIYIFRVVKYRFYLLSDWRCVGRWIGRATWSGILIWCCECGGKSTRDHELKGGPHTALLATHQSHHGNLSWQVPAGISRNHPKKQSAYSYVSVLSFLWLTVECKLNNDLSWKNFSALNNWVIYLCLVCFCQLQVISKIVVDDSCKYGEIWGMILQKIYQSKAFQTQNHNIKKL